MSKVCQLFSGSKGNSIYISCSKGNFLVDAGVSAKRLENALKNINVQPCDLDAVFITHEHSDHISGVRVFASRYNLPVYAHPDVISVMRGIGAFKNTNDGICLCDRTELNGVEIVPFCNSHDSVACYGYRFNLSDGRSVGVCTDTGYVTDDAKNSLLGCDLVFLESNHEVTMLQNGIYPYPLKKRILSGEGHLSNYACGEFAKELVKNGTTRLILSHLSQENNTPDIARQTTLCALNEAGFEENVDFKLAVSPEENYERPIVL